MKYEVTIKEIEIYIIEVDATDEDNAYDKAWDKLGSDDKDDYHSNSDAETEVKELKQSSID